MQNHSRKSPGALTHSFIRRCGPCRMIKPVFSELANKQSGVSFGQIDVDENSEAAAEFGIQSVPTFIFFNGNEPVDRFSGADAVKLEETLEKLDS